MLSDFTYTTVGNVVDGVFENKPARTFDFQSFEFEVCALDMLFMTGSWDCVRSGANIITRKVQIKIRNQWRAGPIFQHYVKPGHYYTRLDLLDAINNAIVKIGKFETTVAAPTFMLTHFI